MSNTWVICREDQNNLLKSKLILNVVAEYSLLGYKSWGPYGLTLRDEPATYQLVGGVIAHQG